MRKPRQPNVRQMKLIHGLIAGKRGVDAARDAGYNGANHTLAQIAYHELQKPHIAAAFQKALDEAGITLNHAAQALAGGYKATKFDSADHFVRLKTAEIHLKATKVLGPTEPVAQIQNNFFGAESFDQFCQAYHRAKKSA